MKIIILMENTNGDTECLCEHGLSVYVETEKHKLLVDTGSSEKTWQNADLLGVKLEEIDTVILSHGHYDHSGGIVTFREKNKTAKIYLHKNAGKPYYHDERYIGIDPAILEMKNVEFVEGTVDLDEEIRIFSEIKSRKLWPSGNRALSVKVDGELQQDEFDHEQCVVIHGEKNILISGCAHNGILNIMDRYRELYGEAPDYVISGFHMMKKTDYNTDEIENVKNTAEELKREKTVFFSGHCTGEKAMILMKPILEEKLIALHSGLLLNLQNKSVKGIIG